MKIIIKENDVIKGGRTGLTEQEALDELSKIPFDINLWNKDPSSNKWTITNGDIEIKVEIVEE